MGTNPYNRFFYSMDMYPKINIVLYRAIDSLFTVSDKHICKPLKKGWYDLSYTDTKVLQEPSGSQIILRFWIIQ